MNHNKNKSCSFHRSNRLSYSYDFYFVNQKPKSFETPYFVVFSRLNKLQHPRIGFIISKKNIRMSYKRNKIKRTTRESFRFNKKKLLKMDFIFLFKKNIVNINNDSFLRILEKTWEYYLS